MRAVVTGSAGLVGYAMVEALIAAGYRVDGVDNDSRSFYFGKSASTRLMGKDLERRHGSSYVAHDIDIRDRDEVERIIADADPEVVVHAAAQPSHDWAASDPYRDFEVNAVGTLHVLEACRQHAPAAKVIFVSTNKVYGDRPNLEVAVERVGDRYDVAPFSEWWDGIPSSFPIDASTHSLFGVSKLSGDVLAQEYARYFGMTVGVFRCGCLTGAAHAGAVQHGFLSYLIRCAMCGDRYTVYGFDGLQVRDNLHADDLAAAFMAWIAQPASGVWNMGGGRENSCSVREAIAMTEAVAGVRMDVDYGGAERIGDHRWWISDVSAFRAAYPDWRIQRDLRAIITEGVARWTR